MTGLSGVLLVGGASRRFGSPKALARFRGETLAERAWRVLGEACDERLAVGKAGELELPFPVLDDGSELRAPIVGVRRRPARGRARDRRLPAGRLPARHARAAARARRGARRPADRPAARRLCEGRPARARAPPRRRRPLAARRQPDRARASTSGCSRTRTRPPTSQRSNSTSPLSTSSGPDSVVDSSRPSRSIIVPRRRRRRRP